MERLFKEEKISKTKKMVILSLLTTIALTIFVIESYLPPLLPIPGIKLGLSNIVTLLVILLWGFKEGALLSFMRITLASIFAGQMMSFIYSLSGGILCLLAMCTFKRIFLKEDMIWLISVIGAIFHNIGQIIAACVFLSNLSLLMYFPVLLISGIVTGSFTGVAVQYLVRKNKIIKNLFNK